MIKVAITGSTGLVGSSLVQLLRNTFEIIPLSSQDIDITNKKNVSETLESLSFDFLIHLAAYTNVDQAEIDNEIANKINVIGTSNILNSVLEKKAKCIYISTGFVFDGKKPPYFEDSQPNPISIYGQTKFEGEKIIGDKGMIVRIEYPYGNSPAQKKDFVRTIKSLLENGKELSMVTNSLMTPTYIDDIAESLTYLIHNYTPEIFHIVGSDSLSPFEAGKIIANRFNLNPSLIRETTYEKYFEGKAKRPQWAEVKTKKNNFCKMKSFEEGLINLK